MNEYPCIKQSTTTNRIVLFIEKKIGYPLTNPDKEYSLGEYINNWHENSFRYVSYKDNEILDAIKYAKEEIDLPLDLVMWLANKLEKTLRNSKLNI